MKPHLGMVVKLPAQQTTIRERKVLDDIKFTLSVESIKDALETWVDDSIIEQTENAVENWMSNVDLIDYMDTTRLPTDPDAITADRVRQIIQSELGAMIHRFSGVMMAQQSATNQGENNND